MDVLLVEDDEAIARALMRVLERAGLQRSAHHRGPPRAGGGHPSVGLVLLDLGLPDIDGLAVCRDLRRARPDLAILILTARDQEMDIVAGLDAGADDYMTKPFRLAELLARVRAHQRRLESAPHGARRGRSRSGTVAGRRRVPARLGWR